MSNLNAKKTEMLTHGYFDIVLWLLSARFLQTTVSLMKLMMISLLQLGTRTVWCRCRYSSSSSSNRQRLCALLTRPTHVKPWCDWLQLLSIQCTHTTSLIMNDTTNKHQLNKGPHSTHHSQWLLNSAPIWTAWGALKPTSRIHRLVVIGLVIFRLRCYSCS